MRRRLPTALILLVTGLAALPALAAPVATASPLPAAADPAVAGQVIAVRGADGALWVASAESTTGRWTSLGGALVSVPAVARGTFGVVYVGIGTDGAVYARTWTTGWREISPPGSRCLQVSAAPRPALQNELYLSCLAPNDRIYIGHAPPGSLVVPRWVSSSAPPGLVRAGITMEGNSVLAIGARVPVWSDRGEGTGPGTTTVYRGSPNNPGWSTVGYSPSGRTSLDCATAPAVAGPYLTLCRRSDDSLYWTYAVHVGGTLTDLVPGVAPGRVIGKVGITGTRPDNTRGVFALGTNGELYRWTVTYSATERPVWTQPSRFGGRALGGADVG